MRDYQEQFIEIVLWALATVLAMALGLSAFSWWTNKTAAQRDREALRQELRGFLTTKMAAAMERLTKGLDDRQTIIQQSVDKVVAGKLNNLTTVSLRGREKS